MALPRRLKIQKEKEGKELILNYLNHILGVAESNLTFCKTNEYELGVAFFEELKKELEEKKSAYK